MYLEGERFASLRVLRAVKNRFGTSNEVAVFEMNSKGILRTITPLVKAVFTDIKDLYTKAKVNPIKLNYQVRISHMENGKIPLRNTGELGEKVTTDMMEDITGKKFKPVQNASNQGADGVFIDHSMNPGTIYIMEVKSSINGVDAAVKPTGSATAKLQQWQQDFQGSKYVNVDVQTQQLIADLASAVESGYAVKGLWVQVEVPKLGSSSINGLDAILGTW